MAALFVVASLSSCLSSKDNKLDPMLTGYLLNALLNVQPVVYVADAGGPFSIAELDPGLSRFRGSITPSTTALSAFVADPFHKRVFSANGTMNALFVSDSSTGQTTSVPLSSAQALVAYDASTGIAFAAQTGPTPPYQLSAIDTATNSVLWTVTTTFGTGPVSLAALPGKLVVGYNIMVLAPTMAAAYDARTGAQVAAWTSTFSSVSGSSLYLSASPDGSALVSVENLSVSSNCLLRVHDPATLLPVLGPINTGFSNLTASAVNPVDQLIHVGDATTLQMHTFSLTSGAYLRTGGAVYSPFTPSVIGLAYSRYLGKVLVVSRDNGGAGRIQLFDPATGALQTQVQNTSGFIASIAVYPGDRY